MKITKAQLRRIIKEELNNFANEGLDQGEKDELTSLKKQLRALGAERSRSDSNAAAEKYAALKDKIKALEDKKHQ